MAVFSNQNIKGAAQRASIHYFDPKSSAGKITQDFNIRENLFFSRAEQNDIGFHFKDIVQMFCLQSRHRINRPVCDHLIRGQDQALCINFFIDRNLIEQILPERVILIVHGAPTLNVATMIDAKAVGVDAIQIIYREADLALSTVASY